MAQPTGGTGYAQSLLVMERFGYPDFFTASATELVDGQYADRPGLRPIYDTILASVGAWENVTVQARKTYVSLTTDRRTFARLQATTRTRLDLALRVNGVPLGPRWKKATVHESMQVQVGLGSTREFDAVVRRALQRAYDQSR
jgi:hypothetical protein